MAISINDRQLITQFITNTQNLNVNLPTNGGGCANLVRGIIEQATGKRISVNPFGASLESMIQKINTYHDLAKCNNGDILYFVHLPNAAVKIFQMEGVLKSLQDIKSAQSPITSGNKRNMEQTNLLFNFQFFSISILLYAIK